VIANDWWIVTRLKLPGYHIVIANIDIVDDMEYRFFTDIKTEWVHVG
jgi:hypothetical protein